MYLNLITYYCSTYDQKRAEASYPFFQWGDSTLCCAFAVVLSLHSYFLCRSSFHLFRHSSSPSRICLEAGREGGCKQVSSLEIPFCVGVKVGYIWIGALRRAAPWWKKKKKNRLIGEWSHAIHMRIVCIVSKPSGRLLWKQGCHGNGDWGYPGNDRRHSDCITESSIWGIQRETLSIFDHCLCAYGGSFVFLRSRGPRTDADTWLDPVFT